MIIELIGCSGAGKSTILEQVRKELICLDIDAISQCDLFTSIVGLGNINNPSVQNLISDLVSMTRLYTIVCKHRSLMYFSAKTLWTYRHSILDYFNLTRSFVRRIGSYEIARSIHDEDLVVLMDEGVLQAAHFLFRRIPATLRKSSILKYTRLVPLPEVIVYVDTPIETAFMRTMSRLDPPLRHFTEVEMKSYLRGASMVFSKIVDHPDIQSRVFRVTNDSNDTDHISLIAQSIVNRIVNINAVHN